MDVLLRLSDEYSLYREMTSPNEAVWRELYCLWSWDGISWYCFFVHPSMGLLWCLPERVVREEVGTLWEQVSALR